MHDAWKWLRNERGKIVNYDEAKQIHYGVINQHKLGEFSLDGIVDNGKDLIYEGAFNDCVNTAADCIEGFDGSDSELRDAMARAFGDYGKRFADGLIDYVMDEDGEKDRLNTARSYIEDEFGHTYENDYAVYLYEEEGYIIKYSNDDGDLFIIDSPYYTLCRECSPCAPNAGYLTDRGGDMKSFCLGTDWFDKDEPPYDVYEVETGALVYKAKEEEESA